ncbi:diaminopimelate dehydrogenase [Lederbergia galactosidilytica]|uniref:Meso-diaminopimelate D-dehydrogenase n=1 Tax=Lederbergia galactosidilytica TaxID=217031 RepID=A0A177ZIA1_9BACI|nr:diaminopimelate dehydrogenase [Lederbergia galactosidilytica]KRG15998.1 cytochrome C2 [Virgibacillus soli]MBP1915614.1 diaminopimelate dehydrogenase [Lederbergia galactosidilytica]OAK67691.1 cytochrome C2 [Lederbergia galactosidilytica]
MENKIRIGIVGYGNLGKGVEESIQVNDDLELVAVFSRREPSSVNTLGANVKVESVTNVEQYKDKIDVMILCGGSATDLPEQGPELATIFNTIDSFDTHAKIPDYFAKMDEVTKKSGTVSIISVGWDPGMFSMNRLLGEAILPVGDTYTFWGKGLSQGHSDAVRRVEGVKFAVQYTIPIDEAVNRVRNGEHPDLATNEKHLRECYVVPEDGANTEKIEETIKTMPHYFADYHTTVHFITEDEFHANHTKMPHGGFVIRSGKTGEAHTQIMEFSLKLDSNPEYTASVLVAYARAAYKLNQSGDRGAKTVLDVPIGLLSAKSPATLRKELL